MTWVQDHFIEAEVGDTLVLPTNTRFSCRTLTFEVSPCTGLLALTDGRYHWSSMLGLFYEGRFILRNRELEPKRKKGFSGWISVIEEKGL